CASTYAESRRLIGLLDLTSNEAGLARLRERIEQEDRHMRRRLFFSPHVRRVAALAALVLLTVGLLWVQPRPERSASEPELQLALMIPGRRQELKSAPAVEVGPIHDKAEERSGSDAVVLTLPMEATGDAMRRELDQAQRAGKLPPPPAVPLLLALRNTG